MPEVPPPFVPDATLADVDPGWWLELVCGGCGRTAYWPRRMLAEAYGARMRVPALLGRLRCRDCRGQPVAAEWVDNPQHGTRGSIYPEKRRVPLALPRR